MRKSSDRAELPRPFVIREMHQETPRVMRFVFDQPLPAQPGQFVMAWLPGVNEKPFSLMDAHPLTLVVAKVGPFTEAMHALRVGDRVWMRGPFGNGFTLAGSRLLLVAGGYGAAPLAFLARRAREASCHVSVVLGARTAAELLLAGYFGYLGCEVFTCTDDGSDGYPMLADERAAHVLEADSFDQLYACGPEAMLEAVERLTRQRGLPAQISREAYMRCGIGVCGSCTCADQLVCRDGPVFRVG